jgi:hypothetical protein
MKFIEQIVDIGVANKLYPYQLEIANAIQDSIFYDKGLTFSVEISRQGGKNELSAQLELILLILHSRKPRNLIKCSPTFLPQTVVSMRRLKDRLNEAGFAMAWKPEMGHIIRLGEARAIFLSADISANVVGNTAHLLLEVDEAQDVSKEKYSKEFRPMCSASNATTVLYGTTWDDSTLLEEVKQTNLELERRDGVKRHFRYDWEEVSKYNPDYRAYVESERERLGENHPLFLTQYRLLPLHDGGGFLSVLQREQLQGEHPRLQRGEAGKNYVAGIDLAGEEETPEALATLNPRRDATVVTIGELDFTACDEVNKEPAVKIVEHYRWVGKKHPELYAQLVDILKNIWHCRRIVVDATGVGEPVASFLRKALGSRVVPFKFTSQSKSELGFNLLAAINGGRLKVYKGDGSEEYKEFRYEMEKAKTQYRPNQTMSFYVEPSLGHDDFLMSLALAAEAGLLYEPRGARGGEREDYNR